MPDETTPTVPPVTPGYKTSEFWVSLMSAAAGCALIVFGAITGKDNCIYLGTTLVGLPAGAYPIARGLAKKS